MLALLKNLGGTWEQARDGLYRDLEVIETTINRWRATTGSSSSSSSSSSSTTLSSGQAAEVAARVSLRL